jgi:hypothetical protein
MQSLVEIRAKGLNPWQCNFCMKWYSRNCRQKHRNQVPKKEVAKQHRPPQLLRLRRASLSCIHQIRRKSPQRSSSELCHSTAAQKQASIADVLADFGTQLTQVMACIQQPHRPLTRAVIREETEAGIKKGVAAALSARKPKLSAKQPAALTACKSPGDLVRYFGGLQQAGGLIWCTSCCESAPAARHGTVVMKDLQRAGRMHSMGLW